MAVQTRNVLKTYFETGDKPTAAQFGNLIDSIFAANVNAISASGTLHVIGNTVYNAENVTGTILIDASGLEKGESIVLNRYLSQAAANSGIDGGSANGIDTSLAFAKGYDDITADSGGGIMSYAMLALNGNSNPTIMGMSLILLLVNRALYEW